MWIALYNTNFMAQHHHQPLKIMLICRATSFVYSFIFGFLGPLRAGSAAYLNLAMKTTLSLTRTDSYHVGRWDGCGAASTCLQATNVIACQQPLGVWWSTSWTLYEGKWVMEIDLFLLMFLPWRLWKWVREVMVFDLLLLMLKVNNNNFTKNFPFRLKYYVWTLNK